MSVCQRVISTFLMLFSCAAAAYGQGSQEVCRIRVENRTGGRVAVSIDGGRSYSTVGHVTVPARRLLAGFPASRWAQEGTVCATAVHAIRVCVAHTGAGRGLLFSIVPREYRLLPDSYGGQRETADSGIYTDIGASTGIFRNLAPFVGNPVFIERAGVLHGIRRGWSPGLHDVIVLIVERPSRMPVSIEFPNRHDGIVEAEYQDGERVAIARVMQPVHGVGRYDATSYTGVGRINTVHPGVITISTAPEAGVDISDERRGWERRGGFQIIPSVHGQHYLRQAGVMIVAPLAGGEPLEGRPPLFSGVIGLTNDPLDNTQSYRVQMKVDHGPWEPLPAFEGIDPLLFTAGPLSLCFHNTRNIKQGVTDFRILFPRTGPEFVKTQLAASVQQASGSDLELSTTGSHETLLRGEVHVNVSLDGADPRLRFLVFLVDGTKLAISDVNSRPYEFRWNTRGESNGRHTVTIRGEDTGGGLLSVATSQVIVSNTGG